MITKLSVSVRAIETMEKHLMSAYLCRYGCIMQVKEKEK